MKDSHPPLSTHLHSLHARQRQVVGGQLLSLGQQLGSLRLRRLLHTSSVAKGMVEQSSGCTVWHCIRVHQQLCTLGLRHLLWAGFS